MKRNSFFWLRFISTLIDLSVIYSVSFLLQTLIWKITFIDPVAIFVFAFLPYYFISYLFFNGSTPAKFLTGLKVDAGSKKIRVRNLFSREFVFKTLIGIILPVYLLQFVVPVWSPLFTISIELIILILSFILLLIFKKTWWESFSKTSTKKSAVAKHSRTSSFIFITCVIGTYLFVAIQPVFPFNRDNIRKSLYTFYDNYPVTQETKNYAAFLKEKSEDPVEYIFDLFKTHDIVVLSERYHPEYTQYELFSKIVSDKRFADSIGNIFTETGTISFQDSLNKYLATPFTNEDELDRQTAILQRNSDGVWPIWTCTNHFEFLKTVYKLNETLPDSNKLNWYFSDIPVNWEKLTAENWMKGISGTKRDSIMGAQIIHIYKEVVSRQKRKKALIIMNSSHGYALYNKSNTGIKWLDGSTTNYLIKAFPDKVANVMINSVSHFFCRVQNGKWETAFKLNDNRPAAFSFKGSPFGNDKWDAFFLNARSLTYKDVFTGFIFYKPLDEQIKKDGYPHELDNFEDTLLRRASCINPSDRNAYKNIIKSYKTNSQSIFVTEPAIYAAVHNAIRLLLLPAFTLFGFVCSLLCFAFRRRNRE